MSKRLTELQRQRALLQEHLAWLDREIAAAQSAAAPSATPTPVVASPSPAPLAPSAPTPTPASPLLDSLPANPAAHLPAPNAAAPDVDQIIAQHEQAPGSLQHDTRRGCLMAFWILLLGTFLVAGIAYALYARHLGRWW